MWESSIAQRTYQALQPTRRRARLSATLDGDQRDWTQWGLSHDDPA
jgi:hypothetical protein